MFLRACLVLTLLERRVLQGRPLSIRSQGRLARPTWQEILLHRAPLLLLLADAHRRQVAIPVAAILAAAGFTDTVDTQVPARNTG